MRLLIVDDEEHVRDGIYYKIDKEKNPIAQVDQAEDGFEALEKVAESDYDIIITDIRMPEMDGLDFIEKAKAKGCDASFIVVSGYDDFDYARRSIRLGVVDYLLKPVKPDALNELIDQIRCSIDLAQVIDSESRNTEEAIHRDRHNDLMNDLLWRGDETEQNEAAYRLSGTFSKERYRVLVLHFRAMSKDKVKRIEDLASLIHHKLSITNGDCDLGFMEHMSHRNELAIIMNFAKGKDELSILQYIIRMLIKEYSIEVAIGIGEVTDSLKSTRESYEEAYFSVLEKMLHGYNKLYYKSRIKNGTYRISDNKRKLLEHYMRQFDQENLCLMIEDQLRLMADNKGINHVSVVAFVTDVFLLIKRYGHISASVRSDEDFIYDLYGCNSLFEVGKLLKSEVRKHLVREESHFDSSKQIVENAVSYIEGHSEESLSLEKMAEIYHIHPNYFSRIFKTHKKVNFNEFVTQVRMEKAMILLKNPEMKVHDVSGMLGYSDAKYFSKVFKKYFGISPSRVTMDK